MVTAFASSDPPTRSTGTAFPVRAGAHPELRVALLVIAGSAVGIAVLEWALLGAAYPELVGLLSLLPMAGLLYVFAGVLAWDRRPSNNTGRWLVGLGFLIMAARLSTVTDPTLATLGLFLAQTPLAGVVVLMLVFPSGRFDGRVDRGLATAAFVLVIGVAIPAGLYRPDDGTRALRIADRPDIVATLTGVQLLLWWVLVGLVVVVLVRRLRRERAMRSERRARIAVYVMGLVSVVALPLVAQLGVVLTWNPLVVFAVQVILIAAVPVVFVTSLLTGGYGRTGRLEELSVWLGRVDPERGTAQDALAEILGDDSLQLLFRSSGSGLVDVEGASMPEPVATGPTGLLELRLRDGSAAVVVYDTAAVPDPLVVEAAVRVVAVSLDRERLTVELLAEREELRRSRARLVDAADEARRQLARDLHDSLQSRLVLAAISAGTLANRMETGGPTDEADQASAVALRSQLEQAVQDLRRTVQGLMPALLLERGLGPAVTELVERCGIPSRLQLPEDPLELPPAVTTNAYFVIAEAVTNSVKHAAATQLTVVVDVTGDPETLHLSVSDNGCGTDSRPGAVSSGAGLQSMADRVAALDGTFTVSSAQDQGCRVTAAIPTRPTHLVLA